MLNFSVILLFNKIQSLMFTSFLNFSNLIVLGLSPFGELVLAEPFVGLIRDFLM